MYSFIVLGLIPGTNIEIGFWAWIVLTILLAIAFKLYKRRLINRVAEWWHQYDDIEEIARNPLPANRLHRRLLPPVR